MTTIHDERIAELEKQLSIARSNASVANQSFEQISTENGKLKHRIAELELALAQATGGTQGAASA